MPHLSPIIQAPSHLSFLGNVIEIKAFVPPILYFRISTHFRWSSLTRNHRNRPQMVMCFKAICDVVSIVKSLLSKRVGRKIAYHPDDDLRRSRPSPARGRPYRRESTRCLWMTANCIRRYCIRKVARLWKTKQRSFSFYSEVDSSGRRRPRVFGNTGNTFGNRVPECRRSEQYLRCS